MSDHRSNACVFIVDDDAAVRTSLSRSLDKRGFVTETFGSAEEFLEAYDADRPGCLVLDYGMPGMSGLELQAHLAESSISIPIIFITGHGGVPESVKAIKMGAVDFLEKPFQPDALAAQIASAFEMDQERRATSMERAARTRKLDSLTPREREIADFICANPSTVSSKEIGRALDISPRTVDHHRARILEKMQLRSIVELIDVMTGLRD